MRRDTDRSRWSIQRLNELGKELSLLLRFSSHVQFKSPSADIDGQRASLPKSEITCNLTEDAAGQTPVKLEGASDEEERTETG